MMLCTWEGCKEPAEHINTDANSQCWSSLCDRHQMEYEEATQAADARSILRTWVKAQGGAKAAARRM